MKYRKETILIFLLFLFYVFSFYIYENGYTQLYGFECIIPLVIFSSLGITSIKQFHKSKKYNHILSILTVIYLLFMWYLFLPYNLKESLFISKSDFIKLRFNKLGIFNIHSDEEIEEIKKIDSEKLGIIISNNDNLEASLEFFFLRDVIYFKNYIYSLDLSNISKYESHLFEEGHGYNPKLMVKRDKMLNNLFGSILELIKNNPKLVRKEFEKELLKDNQKNLYILNNCSNPLDEDLAFESFKKIFKVEKIKETECLKIYELSRIN